MTMLRLFGAPAVIRRPGNLPPLYPPRYVPDFFIYAGTTVAVSHIFEAVLNIFCSHASRQRNVVVKIALITV